MPSHDDDQDVPAVPSGELCPKCGEPLAVDDVPVTCAQCGDEGCTEHCIPGGKGTACVNCESGDA